MCDEVVCFHVCVVLVQRVVLGCGSHVRRMKPVDWWADYPVALCHFSSFNQSPRSGALSSPAGCLGLSDRHRSNTSLPHTQCCHRVLFGTGLSSGRRVNHFTGASVPFSARRYFLLGWVEVCFFFALPITTPPWTTVAGVNTKCLKESALSLSLLLPQLRKWK